MRVINLALYILEVRTVSLQVLKVCKVRYVFIL